MTLRYGSLVTSLRSLRGAPLATPIEPTESAVPYRASSRRGIAPLADVYMPATPTGASVLLVHGGGFVIGSRRMKPMRFLAARLVARGLAVCAVDYRMIFRGGRLDEAVEDVAEALAWWWPRAARLGLDPTRVSIAGLSAGASIALLVASRPSASRLAAVASCFGLYEVDHLVGPAALLPRLLFGTPDRALWIERSPCVAMPPMPTLLVHGSDDGLVPVSQAHRLAAAREARQLPTRLVVYDGAPHGFFNLAVPAADAAVDEIVAYVDPR